MRKFILWCRRLDDNDALWADMPYAARSYEECQALVEHYEDQWGNHYMYEIHPVGFYPSGRREPCFIGHM